MKPTTWIERANVAIEGIIYAVRAERHMRYHLIAAIVTLVLALVLPISRLELIVLCLTITMVLFAEMVNTSIEVVVDRISKDYHPLARIAKDVAAGFVLLTSVSAVVIGYFILYPAFRTAVLRGLWQVRKVPGDIVLFVALIIVILLVIFLKALFGRGEPLRGGMPSGHAAFFFALWAASLHLTDVMLIRLLTFGVAVLIAWSRWVSDIHRPAEVVAGAALGAGVTSGLFWIFT